MSRVLLLPTMLFALAAPAAGQSDGPGEVELAQMTIRERIIVRVPRMTARAAPALPTPMRWKEKGGPKCVVAGDLAGALVTEPDSVDLVLNGGERVRARLDGRCRSLDFYSGFYLKPSADGKVCADRDSLRLRSGASCGIAKFRTLKPERVSR
ncbi:hypothetical protein SAMN05192583_1374 [Sphingomonas gellani]|uniref:Protease inhibitor Inh n=1 Tax=Sphingomonas gellani TaxID=1166340 RepID=A0A1H8BI54_9SPHN|nr:hypothetical protein [Sphingomonas gellani]SEM82436.1 hypothetical protein SAMN05192583_1374 [Sphingomonas gellani]